MEHIAYKYKLKPTVKQEEMLSSIGGACRWLWNTYLHKNQEKYNQEKKFLFKHDMIVSLPQLKKEYTWLADVPSQTLQQRLMDLDKAIKACFRFGFGFPHYKSKHKKQDTFRIPNSPEQIKSNKKSILLPKIGWVKWIRHRPHTGKLKSVTIKQEGKHWFCVVLCETTYSTPISDVNQNRICGIDMGLNSFCVLSDGTEIQNPRFLHQKEKLLKRRQRKLSRLDIKNNKQKTNRRNKVKEALASIHRKVKNTRNDFLHQLSSSITKRYDVVGLEDLNIDGMRRNRKLAKSISDVGWYSFRQMLNYKLQRKGGYMILVNRWFPSTKTCSSCGCVQDMPLSQRIYECNECGFAASRDHNAAINIKTETLNELNRHGTCRIYGQGDTSNGTHDASCVSHVSLNCQNFVETFPEAHRSLVGG